MPVVRRASDPSRPAIRPPSDPALPAVRPVVGTRYTTLFDTLRERREGAFVPFFVLGDPDLQLSAELLRAAVRAGADALEVGIPFSDPVADGPTLQRANLRAFAAGATVAACFELLAAFRADFPHVPVGLLTYANLVVQGGLYPFYARARDAGLDSVLVADVPLLEAEPFTHAARAHGIAPVLLAPPNLPADRLPRLKALSDGYTYCVSRKGVTGITSPLPPSHDVIALGPRDRAPRRPFDRTSSDALPAPGTAGPSTLFSQLRAAGAPPPLLGFGISTPDHVRAAIAAGAAGAITGSAVAHLLEGDPRDHKNALTAIPAFIRAMKEATRGAPPRFSR